MSGITFAIKSTKATQGARLQLGVLTFRLFRVFRGQNS